MSEKQKQEIQREKARLLKIRSQVKSGATPITLPSAANIMPLYGVEPIGIRPLYGVIAKPLYGVW